ncbi:hypothetical protein CHS0354_007142 [Potamilus streckersoni]|uniref:Uncharacterized protein n=1 Tax=Potamilus streckersoni TaxID=2493646 RepID=A0AAE0SM87_9BIVA|nr:hypothetical protein CHS0354_007142 [Potamilus streckersoni]
MTAQWDGDRQKSIKKRDATPVIVKQNPGEPPFEEYERQFLIQRILDSLTQIYYYAKYLDPDSFPDDDDTDKYASTTRIPDKPSTKSMGIMDRSITLLELKRRQLELMSAEELRTVFNSLSDSIQQGLTNPVASLSSLCCPIEIRFFSTIVTIYNPVSLTRSCLPQAELLALSQPIVTLKITKVSS